MCYDDVTRFGMMIPTATWLLLFRTVCKPPEHAGQTLALIGWFLATNGDDNSMLRILCVGFPWFACHDNYVFAFRCLGIDISLHVFVGKLPKIIEGAFGMHPLAEILFDSNHFQKVWFKAWLLVLCHSDHKCFAEKSFKKGELPPTAGANSICHF